MRFDEAQRLRALADYRVLDSQPEAVFDNITRLAAKIFGTPIALVSLIDERRQWFKSRIGVEVTETPREYAFCDHAIRDDATLVVEDATKDPRFVDNPLVTGDPGIRFYCGVVLHTPEGDGLGTLCIIDKVPRTMSPAQRTTLETLARQVETELEIRRRLMLLESTLDTQRQQQEAKEMLASMLVHDLRGPLTSISLLSESLVSTDEESRRDIEDLQIEVERAQQMLTDVLDICLSELGGLRLRRADVALNSLITKVVQRMQRRGRARHQAIQLDLPAAQLTANLDPELIVRVVENLLANAIHHGPARKPITVSARAIDSSRVRVEVCDGGEVLPPAIRETIFRAFESHRWSQSDGDHRQRGLGLAFCRLAVDAHNGVVAVEPGANGGNCFFVELPTGP